VIALHDDSSFHAISQPVHTMNFMLKPSHMVQVIIPVFGKSILFNIVFKAFTGSPYTAKLSPFTVRLHVGQLDDLR
jgi:hypothetical protein